MNDDKERKEAAYLLAERPSNADIMREKPPGSDKTYIELAIMLGDLEVMNSADARFKNTPLHWAVIRNQPEMVQKLLGAGASVKEFNIVHHTPLHASVNASVVNLDIIKQLVQAGADLNVSDFNGVPLLHTACSKGYGETVNFLIQSGASVDLQDQQGRTASYVAIEAGQEEIAARLVTVHHADPTIKTYKGKTLYHAAALSPEKKSLADMIPISPRLAAMEHDVDIFRRSASYYSTAIDNINTTQSRIIANFIAYLKVMGREGEDENEFIDPNGYCAGFTLFSHVFDSLKQHDVFKLILEALASWDKSAESLSEPLEGKLNCYGTLEELFEKFFSPLTLAQMIIEITKSIEQADTGVVLALVGANEGFHPIFHRLEAATLNRAQLEEMLTVLQQLPGSVRFRFGSVGHVLAFKVNAEHQFQYSDSNFETADWAYAEDARTLTTIIEKTKAGHHEGEVTTRDDKGNLIFNGVNLSGFYFDRDRVPMETFNYFSRAVLPHTRQEVEACIANSPSGFSQFHLVLMTNSQDNFRVLLDREFCMEFMQKSCTARWKHHRPIDILFATRNTAMCKMFFDKVVVLEPSLQDALKTKLIDALETAVQKLKSSLDIEDMHFLKEMVKYLDEKTQMKMLNPMIEYTQDAVFLDHILSQKIFDKITLKSLEPFLQSLYCNERIKALINKHLNLQAIEEEFGDDKAVQQEVLRRYEVFRKIAPNDLSVTASAIREFAECIRGKMPVVEFLKKVTGAQGGVVEVFNLSADFYKREVLEKKPEVVSLAAAKEKGESVKPAEESGLASTDSELKARNILLRR